MWALPVDKKGPVPYVVSWIADRLESVGYTGMKLTMKSDQDTSVDALQRAVALRRQAVTTLIASPVLESQSYGAIERAIRTWEGQFRKVRHQCEGNIHANLEMSHPLVEWMTVWAEE